MSYRIHELNRVDGSSRTYYRCEGCPFTGSVWDAVRHAVAKQFRVDR